MNIQKETTLKKRIFAEGETEEWQVYKRVADFLGNDDEERKEFFDIMNDNYFLPNSPCLASAGVVGGMGQLTACFVLPIEDSMKSIFETLTNAALIMKSGGGVGYNFSALRSKGSRVGSTNGVASGVVSFMTMFDTMTEVVKSGGLRKGANIAILNIDHPDIFDFIDCKNDLKAINNFNLSIAITDKFVEAVVADELWCLKHDTIKEVRYVRAKDLYDTIINSMRKVGEPGILFIDEINKQHLFHTGIKDLIKACNPCVIGDTLIRTVHGLKRIKDLVGKEIDVYCVNEKNELKISKAYNIVKTRENAKLVKVKTRRGDLICTPEHLILTKTGYVKAIDLKPKMLLVGLNYKMVNENQIKVGVLNKFIKEHRFVAGHYEDITGKDVHHLDGNSFNNDKDNLAVLSHDKHSIVSNLGHEDWSERNNDGTFKKKLKKVKKRNLKLPNSKNNFARFVLEVEVLDYEEDVYDMTVETYHNFFANDFVVHNCGETILLDYENCCLGAINLFTIAKEHIIIGSDRFKEIIRTGIKFLNRIVDKTTYPLEANKEIALRNRKIGLGVMGYADMLIIHNYEYGSKKALTFTEGLAHFIKKISKEEGLKYGNKTVNVCQPTGTLSILANCSSGIEPLFALEQHIDRLDEHFVIVPSIVKWYKKEKGYDIEGDKLKDLKDILLFKTANDIPYTAHLETQAIWQKYIDNSISKTINLPSNASVDDVDKSFMLAYELKCKGFTVYRDGCRDTQVLNHKSKAVEVVEVVEEKEVGTKPKKKKRPTVLQGETPKYITGCGNLYVTVNKDEEGNIIEIFTNTGRSGGCPSQSEATSRILSVALRGGMSQEEMYKQLKGIRCMSCIKSSKTNVLSCPDAIAKAIGSGKEPKVKSSSEKETVVIIEEEKVYDELIKMKCPECNAEQKQIGNCFKCTICGYSKCGG